MKKYKVLLFQPYLRKHILNFGKRLKNFEFVNIQHQSKYSYSAMLPNFDKEINRRKDQSWFVHLRRLFGIPNMRIKFTQHADILFTYGCLLFTNKPYATYIESGLALFNYDMKIAQNPIARWLVSYLATRPNCRKLIFLSQAGKKSFYSTIRYAPKVARIMKAKSVVIYPLVNTTPTHPKKRSSILKLLFVGVFYMKGGMELAHAYERLVKEKTKLTLTIITPVHTLRPTDIEYLKSLPGLKLLDAKFNETQMNQIYKNHDLFVLPTYREGFGLVVIEALANGMPVIINKQYATAEMAIDDYNGFIYPNHPLKDYNPKTYRLLGRYNSPKDFYADLFRLQKEGKLKPVENFLISSIKRFLDDPSLLERFSKNSLALYKKKFDADKLSQQIEAIFLQVAAN